MYLYISCTRTCALPLHVHVAVHFMYTSSCLNIFCTFHVHMYIHVNDMMYNMYMHYIVCDFAPVQLCTAFKPPPHDLRLESPRGHEFSHEDEDLPPSLLSALLCLPGVIQAKNVRVLESLQDGHLFFKPGLLCLVVPVLLGGGGRMWGEEGGGAGEGEEHG